MRHPLAKPKFISSTLRVALCYVFALQAFAASVSAANAFASGGFGAGLAICHTSENVLPSEDNRTPADLPCELCAIATAAVALPNPTPLGERPQPTVSRIARLEAFVLLGSLPARAASARAPPNVA